MYVDLSVWQSLCVSGALRQLAGAVKFLMPHSSAAVKYDNVRSIFASGGASEVMNKFIY